MPFWDILATLAVVACAVGYLYRRFTTTKGCSCGSSSCCSRQGAAASCRSLENTTPCIGCGCGEGTGRQGVD
ncbi:hypothetical protein JWJ90_00810 [Desulfobulbus rhabdoformis]|uniref:hypothetical protein n=1 Tax=Desulfobulbus rhabdoformis TaxID=34032 RepID=UPI0019631DDD|nr:hypothetical protein [Desulfobulbus rhabdoformis]MBM9612820.1 hypothetical protein [Desulfobulbus rhabdoformis]